jgi:hypothetical protein
MHEVHGRLPDSSVVEIDTIKRMVDPSGSSTWRRQVALDASVNLAQSLLEHGRSVITETHSRWHSQAERFQSLAAGLAGVSFASFLITAPYKTCLERAKQRIVPDITYCIDEPMVSAYYVNLEPLADEPTLDTSRYSAVSAAQFIVQSLSSITMEGV